MTKLYDGQDGSKWVETGEVAPKYSRAVKGRPYLCDKGTPRERVVVDNGVGEFYESVPILRLATPEEIAAHGKFDIDLELKCNPDELPVVHLTPESVGKAYRNGFTKVTVETRREGGYRVRGAYNQVGQEYWVKEDGKLADRCEAWAATFHNVKDKDLDLISEWDEKAEAGVTPEGAATPNACTAKKAASAPPAQPEILPTCPCCKGADGFRLDVVDGHLTAIPVFNSKPGDALRVCPECWKPDANAPQGVEPDAPDRRTEHVPVAKAWVNPAMLGR